MSKPACRRQCHTVTLTCASGTASALIEVHVLPYLLPSAATFRYHHPPRPCSTERQDDKMAGIAGVAEAVTSLEGGPGSVGLIQWLSTNGFRRPWSNAAQDGTVEVTHSDWMTGPELVVGAQGCLSSSHNKRGSWFAIELPKGLWLVLTRYSLRHGDSSAANALRNWELQGSADGEHWMCLRRHEQDASLNARFEAVTWGVGAAAQGGGGAAQV